MKSFKKYLFLFFFIFGLVILCFGFWLFSSKPTEESQTPVRTISSDGFFKIISLDQGQQKEVYETSFPVDYAEKHFAFNFSNSLVLEISQTGNRYADLEKISLSACGQEIAPTSAQYRGTDESVLDDILKDDYNVAVLGNKTIEVFWSVPNCKSGVVFLKANAHGESFPFRYPDRGFVSYVPQQNKTIKVDGNINEVDGTKTPYAPYWRPSTGHPDGTAYIYVNDDKDNFYFSIDATMDNTNELEFDWAEITIGDKKFRIDDSNSKWGQSGFGITSKVSYKHQLYEFAIPKKIVGDKEINFAVRYYGTAGRTLSCGGDDYTAVPNPPAPFDQIYSKFTGGNLYTFAEPADFGGNMFNDNWYGCCTNDFRWSNGVNVLKSPFGSSSFEVVGPGNYSAVMCPIECPNGMAGSGTSTSSPCEVENWTDLNAINTAPSLYYKLVNNLSSSTPDYGGIGNSWTPIGTSVSQFTGYFNGNSHSISNLVVSLGSPGAGLFGYNAVGDITNLSLANVSISGTSDVGGLVGYHTSGNIASCSVSGTVTGSGDDVGGLVGYFIDGAISNSYSTANVTSTAGDSVGGLVGYFIDGSATDSYATGNVSATGGIGAVGGLIGYVVDGVDVTRCHHATGIISGAGYGTGGLLGYVVDGNVYDSYATGNVNSTGRDVGGLIGGMYDTVDHTISDSYATGQVTASSYDVGGLVGILNTGSITSCYATGQVTGEYQVGGLVGYQLEDTTSITNSYATGNVIGTSVSDGGFGGLVGYKVDGTITKSYATGDVSGHDWVGGLAGDQDWGLITNSYATGSVTGTGDQTGGLVGWFDGDLTNSFSAGAVSGVTDVGGLLGYDGGSGTITNSYWDTITSGQALSAGGTGKTTAEMKTIVTFGAWSINTTTTNLNNGYPFLSWQTISGPFDWLITFISNTAPNAPTLVSPANASATSNNKPTLSANYSDPDAGDVGTTNYRISSSSLADCTNNINIVASGTSAVTSTDNENTSWTPLVSIGADATYFWCAQNDDGSATSSWTQMGNFVLDTTAPTITITQPNTSSAPSKTITATASDGTLFMSNTTGAVCDGTLAFIPYASQTFSSESDNGIRVCYKSVDSLSNIGYRLSSAISGITVVVTGGGMGQNYTYYTHTECDNFTTGFYRCVVVEGAGQDQCDVYATQMEIDERCRGCLCDKHGDINKDGRRDLRDLSIMMFYWEKTNPDDRCTMLKCADINQDKVVDLRDFSILLYYWSG